MDAFCSMIMTKKFIELGYPKMNVVMKARQTPTINIPCMKEITVVKEIKEGDEDFVVVVDAGSMAQCLDYAKILFKTPPNLLWLSITIPKP